MPSSPRLWSPLQPRQGRQGWGWRICYGVLKPAFMAATRYAWSGMDNVPRHGGVVLAANHVSHIDPFHFAHYCVDGLGRLPRFLAKKEIFAVPVVGAVMRSTGMISVDRGAPTAAASLEQARRALLVGECVAVYVEGTVPRDSDGWPTHARTGAVRLALATGAPLVPVAIWGSQQQYRNEGRWFQGLRLVPRAHVQIHALPPLDLTPWQGRPVTSQVLQEATFALLLALRDGVGQLRGERPPPLAYPGERDDVRRLA